MAEVRLEGVTKVYPDGTRAVSGLDLVLADGELLVLVGPSGCGKTTALRMVKGLEHITAGTISIGGRVVNDLSESERDIAVVFRNYALYPHMSVHGNIAFPLKLELLDQKPAQLSGGSGSESRWAGRSGGGDADGCLQQIGPPADDGALVVGIRPESFVPMCSSASGRSVSNGSRARRAGSVSAMTTPIRSRSRRRTPRS